MKYIIAFVFSIFLAACNASHAPQSTSTFDGSYSTVDGKSTVTFTPEGKVKWDGAESTYIVDGNMAKLQFPNGLPTAFVMNPDGSISLNGVETYKKR